MKLKVINIIQHPPAYRCNLDNERPEICWDTPGGAWVGIWEGDFADLFGKEILKISSHIEYEVWRPDLRADKIYSHTFESGVMHKSFPAKSKKVLHGLKVMEQISSASMLEYLNKTAHQNTILHQNTLGDYLNQEIARRFYHLPKVINFHGKATSIPAKEMLRPRKNMLGNAFYFRRHRELLKNKKIYFVYQNSTNIEALSRYNSVGIARIFSGCDFNYFKKENKLQVKKELGIGPSTTVLSMASRFIKLKQIDRIVEILTEIEKKHHFDFILMLAGRGESSYEEYLKGISTHLLKKNKLRFTGFLVGGDLLKLYQASDLFISASTTEGGPTSIIKAVACETPVFCTRVGGVDDILEQHHAGVLVDKFAYKQWYNQLIDFLERRLSINLMDRKQAGKIFHRPNAAKKFIEIYETLSKYF